MKYYKIKLNFITLYNKIKKFKVKIKDKKMTDVFNIKHWLLIYYLKIFVLFM